MICASHPRSKIDLSLVSIHRYVRIYIDLVRIVYIRTTPLVTNFCLSKYIDMHTHTIYINIYLVQIVHIQTTPLVTNFLHRKHLPIFWRRKFVAKGLVHIRTNDLYPIRALSHIYIYIYHHMRELI